MTINKHTITTDDLSVTVEKITHSKGAYNIFCVSMTANEKTTIVEVVRDTCFNAEHVCLSLVNQITKNHKKLIGNDFILG